MSGSDNPANSVALGKDTDGLSSFAPTSVASEQDLCALMRDAEKNSTAVLVGSDARIPSTGAQRNIVRIDMSAMNRVLEHQKADQVILVETGMTVGSLNAFLREHRQWWPVSLPEHWTVGQAINWAEGGAIEHEFGGPRNLVLGMKVALANGTAIRTGGKVVKNVTGYDLNKAFVGSHGSLGVPFQAYLRLYALPAISETILHFYAAGAEALAQAHKVIASGLPCSSVAILGAGAVQSVARDCSLDLPGNFSFCLAVRMQGVTAVIAEIMASVTTLLGETQGTVLAGDEERNFWNCQEKLFDTGHGDNWVRINLPMSLMSIAFHTLATENCFRALPLPGKIVVRTQQESVSSLINRLGAGRTADESAIVGFADNDWNYRVVYLPQREPALAVVKQRLKDQLDPNHILNPFVSL